MNLIKIKTSSNLLNWWNFGSLISISMAIQISTGVFLSMNYFIQNNMFMSSMNIFFNTNYGWVMRIIHSNTTSLIFILMFIHMKRSLYFNAHVNKPMWMSGLAMLLIIMAESFIGYSLIWNQMSYWAMMVITNFLSSIPIIGNSMVLWLWGNFKIDKILINRFFSMHFIIPFIILMMMLMHLMILHLNKSMNPIGISNKIDLVNLNPIQLNKDFMFFIFMVIIFINLSMFNPFFFNNNDNFIMMNYFKTPPHIEPEWYFLFFFSILRSINNKLSGLMILILSIAMMFIIPKVMKNKIQFFHSYGTLVNSTLMFTILMISILSTKNPEYPYLSFNIMLIAFFFLLFPIMFTYSKMFSMKF